MSATKPQAEFHRSSRRFRAFVSGIGAGKTFSGAVEILRMPPGTTGLVAAPTYRMLADATIATIKEIFGDLITDYVKSDMTMTLVDGKKILLRSADEPERLRGPNLGWFWLDEGAMMDELAWKIMVGRLRLDPGRAWVTTTPRGKVNWVYKNFVRDGSADLFDVIQCNTASNIYLPDFFLKQLEAQYTGAWRQQEYEGEFVDFNQNAAYHEFKRSINVQKGVFEEYYNPRQPIAVACDFNIARMCWPIIQVTLDGQPVVITEIEETGRTNVHNMCGHLRRRFPDHPGGIHFYGDASGQGGSSQTGFSHYDLIEAELRNHTSDVQFFLPKSNPNPRDRILTVNDVLRGTGLWQPLLIDEDEAPVFIEDFENVILNETGSDVEKIKNADDERSLLTHATDGFGYWACVEAPNSSWQVAQSLEAARGELRVEREFQNDSGGYQHGQGLWGV
jgi:hypothetical protein